MVRFFIAVCLLIAIITHVSAKNIEPPNIVLMMADDLGWGDVGFQGNQEIKTPNLDQMAEAGLRFTRFYVAAPVCSPTRGSCLTGRHPYRYGIFFANTGHLPAQDLTLAELLKSAGYATGHFGKWHLGTLTASEKDSNRGGPRNKQHYAPPWEHGFETCFSTEAKVPTWNPMFKPGTQESYGTAYWLQNGTKELDNLHGDDSRVIMDRVIPFIQRAVGERKKPFFAIIWFHTPHLPVLAGPKYRSMYSNLPEKKQHYYGSITAMDEQIGRLRKELRRLNIANKTMLWFCSDNGPEGNNKAPGSTGSLRGRKRSLFEGGIRVPGVLEWPEKVKPNSLSNIPASTNDYLPTILDLLGIEFAKNQQLDGISLMPLINGNMNKRPRPISFQSRGQLAIIDNRYKLISIGNKSTPSRLNEAESKQQDSPNFMLFDLLSDPKEQVDLHEKHPKITRRLSTTLYQWRISCQNSLAKYDHLKGKQP